MDYYKIKFIIFILFNFIFHKNNAFDKVFSLHLDYLNKLNMKQLNINNNFNYIESKINNTILHNYYFSNKEFRKVRLSYLINNECKIFNSVWYPSYYYDSPILTIDLINSATDKSFCFVNLINMFDNNNYLKKYEDPYISIKYKYHEFINNNIIKYPYKNFLSKAMLYRQINEPNIFETNIIKILDEYLDEYTNSKHFIKTPQINRNIIRDKQLEYNQLNIFIKNTNYIGKKYFDKKTYFELLDYYYKFDSEYLV